MGWQANPKQAIFLGTFADVDEVFLGGAAGGGKTEALLIYAFKRRMEIPNSAGIFMRRTFAELEMAKGAIAKAQELYAGHALWREAAHKFVFPNGSEQYFGHCKEETDKYNYQSSQPIDLCLDELTHFTESIFRYIALGRVRSTIPGVRAQIRCASNPGNIGHKWVKKYFVDLAPYQVHTFPQVDPITGVLMERTRAFIPAYAKDNAYLLQNDPTYGIRLAQQYSLNERRGLLEGRWDLFEGQAFDEWDPSIHVVRPFAVPVEWPRWYAVDYGYDEPWCCLWFTKDMNLWATEKITRYYCYYEMYKAGVPAHYQALQIQKFMADQRVKGGVADASMWQNYQAGTSLIGYYNRAGLYPHKGPAGPHRATSKGHMHWLLGKAEDGLPRVQIFQNCPNLIRTIPEMQLDPDRPEVLKEGDDHAVDAFMYWGHEVVVPRARFESVPVRIAG